MKGIIEINNIEFFAFHGCHESERTVGNKFTVDLSLVYDCTLAVSTDNIENALNYQLVCNIVASEMQKSCNLLEHLASNILTKLKDSFPELEKAKVKVCKHNPPIGCKINYTSVTLEM